MPQPNSYSSQKLRWRDVQAADLDKLLNALQALDRAVVEISMKIYKVPRRDWPAMLKQHRRLHDMVRERLAAVSLAD